MGFVNHNTLIWPAFVNQHIKGCVYWHRTGREGMPWWEFPLLAPLSLSHVWLYVDGGCEHASGFLVIIKVRKNAFFIEKGELEI